MEALAGMLGRNDDDAKAWLEQFGFGRNPNHLALFERDRFCQSSSKLLTADLTYR